MTDAAAAEAVRHEPLALQANSYDFHKLHQATMAATRAKDPRTALGNIAADLVLDKGRDTTGIAVPEGHVIKDVEDAQGKVVQAPVYDAKVADEQADEEEATRAAPAPSAAPASGAGAKS